MTCKAMKIVGPCCRLFLFLVPTSVGAQWFRQESNITERLRAVSAIGDTVAWASSNHGTFVRTTNVRNTEPIISICNVQHEGSADMYDKGQLVPNTLRSVINDDELWFSILKGI
jgi:hypothetical protein